MFSFFKSRAAKTSSGPTLTTLSPKEVHERASRGEIQLVDVREAAEWAGARIPGAVHAPLSSLQNSLAALTTDKPLVFHCLSGKRSASAVAVCRKLGLPHATHMSGGISGWRAAGLPVEH